MDPRQEEIPRFAKAQGKQSCLEQLGKGWLGQGGPGLLSHSGRARPGAPLLKWEAWQRLLPKDPHQGTPEFRDCPHPPRRAGW